MSNPRAAKLANERSTALRRQTWQRLKIEDRFERFTHYLFRYPAKFHPPVARALIERYTSRGDVVLDPFCGSGTLLVEARTMGRSSIGVDVDPLAVAIARSKVHRFKIPSLRVSADLVVSGASKHRRSPREYKRLMFEDLSDRLFARHLALVKTYVPDIPNLLHWFRRYVVIDLARIMQQIEHSGIPETHRQLLRVVFASVIRNASNADPVPVSGLEVTSHMRQRDRDGRLVDPFDLFDRAIVRALNACEALEQNADPLTQASVRYCDATRLDSKLVARASAVITSPPYHGAVDYYRRHKLEMFWLGLTKDQHQRIKLKASYVGRTRVPQNHPFLRGVSRVGGLAESWERRIRSVSKERADAFRHYVVAMSMFFEGLSHIDSGAPVVLVVGHSAWNQVRIPTTEIFAEIAGDRFSLDEVLWYPVKNRYMSYARHNGASIDREYVIVFRRNAAIASSWTSPYDPQSQSGVDQ